MSDTLDRIGQLNNTAQKTTEQVLVSTLKTCIAMLKDRGHDFVQACQTMDEITQNIVEARPIVTANGRGRTDAPHTCVYFHNEDRVGVKALRQWIENSTADAIIVVSLEGPTAFTKREVEQNCPQVQFFLFRDLCVNITRHTLVPKHELVSETDIPVELSASKHELPMLWTTDRVAQYYAYRPGDIVRITRTAGTQEPVHYYRIVRHPPAS